MAKFKQLRSNSEILTDPALRAILEDLGSRVMAAAKADPNQEYTDSLEMTVRQSPGSGRKVAARTVVQVGAVPGLGNSVEAKRGTMARALGAIGA